MLQVTVVGSGMALMEEATQILGTQHRAKLAFGNGQWKAVRGRVKFNKVRSDVVIPQKMVTGAAAEAWRDR